MSRNSSSSDDEFDGAAQLNAITRLLMPIRMPSDPDDLAAVHQPTSNRNSTESVHSAATLAAIRSSSAAFADIQQAQRSSSGIQIPIPAAAAASAEDGRYCWVCFATDEDDDLAEWVQPCNCTGTIRWVHQSCLQRWVDEKQKGNSMRRVTCPQCQTEYIIIYPPMSYPMQMMERFDTMIKCLSPFLAAGIMVGSLYWTAVSYGAVTVFQVVGHQEGLDMMERADPLVLLIGLPAIPVGLVLGRMLRWEDMILRLIQNRHGMARKFPLMSLVLPLPDETMMPAMPNHTPAISDQVSGTRVFCGALLLPTFSTIIGRVFFDSIQNNVHRTLIGGLTFIVLKGALKIYFKQKQFVRKKQRRIMDYTAENKRKFAATQTAAAAAAAARPLPRDLQFEVAI